MNTMGGTSHGYIESLKRTMRRRSNNLWDKLDNAVAERILAQIPTAELCRCKLVCRRWRSLIQSPSFQMTCQLLFDRPPWFYMLDERSPANVVYDMEVNNWRHANLLVPTDVNGTPRAPVATSNNLVCFKGEAGTMIACNPLSGSTHLIPWHDTDDSFQAIAMNALGSVFKVFIVFEKEENAFLKVFSSVEDTWTTEVPMTKIPVGKKVQANDTNGKVVFQEQASIEWIAMKELSAVTVLGSDGQVMVYYLNPSGRLMGCDTQQGIIWMYPRISLEGDVSAVDVVECGGRILVVLLIHDFGIAMLEVWEFNHEEKKWEFFAEMPQEMTEAYDNLEADINCAGHGDYIMVCITSENSDLNQVVMFNIIEDSWVELPRCLDRGGEHFKKFVCAYPFVPNTQANV